jgi:hypothetical protein
MKFLMSNALIAKIWLNSSRMRSKEIVLNAKLQFRMTEKILVVSYGVHLPPLIRETFVLNSNDQRINFTGVFDLDRPLITNGSTSHSKNVEQTA